MASQYYHLLIRNYQERSFFGTTIHPIVLETGKFSSGKSWRRIKPIKPEIQINCSDEEIEDFINFEEEQVKEKIDQLYEDYQDYNTLYAKCSKKKKTSYKSTCVDVSDDNHHVLPVVLPIHSIVIQDYTKPSNSIGYKATPKEPTSEDKKKAFKGLKQNRKCSRNKQRDFKQDKASQSYLLD